MTTTRSMKSAARWLAAGAATAAAAYGAYAAVTWWKYGKNSAKPTAEEFDELLDRFMPAYEVVERHSVRVDAPAAVTLAVARNLDVTANSLASALFKIRALALGGAVDMRELPHRLVEQMQAIGWQVLADVPDKELVLGAVAKPWQADPEFRGVAAAEFASFNEPDYVKIVWTLRADALDPSRSIFRTETRVSTTDLASRARFRRYWALVSPGVAIIRRLMLGPIKREAEKQAAIACRQLPGVTRVA